MIATNLVETSAPRIASKNIRSSAMEALIVMLFALAIIVLLEASYRMTISLLHWMPALAVGVLTFWLANHHGVEFLEASALAFLSSLCARHLMLTRF